MKLADLLLKQSLVVQIVWGEQKIEFPSNVVEIQDELAYITPYLHNGSALQLSITEGAGVVCNVFTDSTVTGQRISWRNIELTTLDRNGKTLYCLRTRGFNNIANPDDRRGNERVVVQVDGVVIDKQNDEELNVTVYDISGVGISFHAPKTYVPKAQQLVIMFTDVIDKRTFNLRVEGSVSRVNAEEGHTTVGCRLVGENRDYQLYRLIKHLREKNGTRSNVINSETAANLQQNEQAEQEAKTQPLDNASE